MSDDVLSDSRQRRVYPKLWDDYSVTSVSYRLGQLGWNSATAHAALEKLLGCEIELSTVRTGVSDGDNPKYEKGKAAPLTPQQITELAQAAGRPDLAHPPEPTTVFPEELVGADLLVEGACRTVTVNAYERDPEVRRRCIEAHGIACAACGMSFGGVYGSVAAGYIHVHHLRPLSEVGAAHTVDPIKDLRPVCPNCHAVLHRRVPPYSVEEVLEFMAERQRQAEQSTAADRGPEPS